MAIKLSQLGKITTLEKEDLIYIVKPANAIGNKSKGIEKDDFVTSLNLSLSSGSRLVSGGMVWVSGLTYESVDLVYEIAGETFNITNGTTVTLATADGSDPRIDLIYGDDLGFLNKSTGTPAATPTANTLPAHQFQLTLATVSAGASEPDGVSIRTVYTEDAGQSAEFDATESTSGARITLGNTSSPLTGSKDIKTVTPNNGDLITLVHSTHTTIINFASIELDIKVATDWGNDYLVLKLLDSSVEVGVVNINSSFLNITDTSSTQRVNIFKSDFTLVSGQTEFDKITIFHRVRGSSALSYQLDEFYINEDAGQTEPIIIPTHTGQVTGDTELTVDKTTITDQILVTAVGADTVWIIDATDGELKKALISDFASAGGDMAVVVYDPATIAEQLVGLTATQTLTNKTLTSPILNTQATGTAIKDEDNMSSDSATHLATQQSIKAYVDASGGGDTLPIVDTTAVVKGSGDNTKLVRIEADGLTTATTRVINMPDVDVTLATPTELTKLGGIETSADVTDNTNVDAAGALMDSELTSIADVKALDQSVISGATPTFGNDNFTEATDKNYVTDAEAVVIGNTSGTNTGDEPDSSVTVKGIVELATVAEADTGTDTARAVTPQGLKSHVDKKPEVFIITCSNFETDLALDLAVGYFDFPYNFTITEIIGTVKTAPTGASIIADVNVDASTIITTDKVEIEATEVSTLTATTKPTITDAAHTKGQRLTVDIDQIGSTIEGQDLEIQIIGFQT